MCFVKHPFLLRTTHQTKGNTAPLPDIPTEKMDPVWISIQTLSKLLLKNQLRSISNTQSVCHAYVINSPQFNFNEKLQLHMSRFQVTGKDSKSY